MAPFSETKEPSWSREQYVDQMVMEARAGSFAELQRLAREYWALFPVEVPEGL